MRQLFGYPSRETAVAVIAGVMLVFTGWAWGGVVLWTQFATCALGALALLVALTPRERTSPWMPQVRHGYATSLVIGGFAAAAVCGIDLFKLFEQRASTLELLPGAQLPTLGITDWGTRGLAVGVAIALAGIFFTALCTPTHARQVLLRFPPFWIGLSLFVYIAIQSLNPWGLVVERDLTWKILPQDHIGWLPAGLAAPFVGDNDPGGMNGWRQMLILSGPWMLLCALRISVLRIRALTILAWVVCLNSLAIGVVGAITAAGKEFSFLGFKTWFAYHAPYGPFIYKNHAGIYLYLSAAIALALTAHLIAKKGDRADRGGPHLISGMVFVMLSLAAGSTMSIGAILGAGILLLLAPALYFIDPRVRSALSPAPAVILLACGLIVCYMVARSTNLDAIRQRIEKKQSYVVQKGSDDRAPIRRAILSQMEDGGRGKLVFGWGAGSYRWTSPVYFAKQPEFLDAKGRLWARANFAHCDWLQALLEWGAFGGLVALASIIWLLGKIHHAWSRRSAVSLGLALGVVILLAHVMFDFALYFTPHLSLIALIIAWLSVAESADERSRQQNLHNY